MRKDIKDDHESFHIKKKSVYEIEAELKANLKNF
jgi:hypothetical protein